MTYKTPEQIAEATVESFEPDDRMSVNPDDLTYTFGYPLLKDMLVAAIEADRAQRQPEIYIVQNEAGTCRWQIAEHESAEQIADRAHGAVMIALDNLGVHLTSDIDSVTRRIIRNAVIRYRVEEDA